jgi:lambda family phage portal protein
MKLEKPNLLPGSYTALGYQAATYSRNNGIYPTNGSADLNLRYDLDIIRRRSQQLDRDNSIYNSIITRSVDNIVGSGFSLKCCTGDLATNQQVEELWRLFCEDPEVRGELNFNDVEKLILRSIFVEGDILVIKTTDGKIQLIESERLDSIRKNTDSGNRIELGVELDKLGKALNYFVSDVSPFGNTLKSAGTAYRASDCLLLANRTRISQTRGVPVLVSAFPIIQMLQDILSSEAISRQLLSRIALSINRNDAESKAYLESALDSYKTYTNTEGTPAEAQLPQRYQEFDSAIIFHGEIGEKIESLKRDIPGPGFTDTVNLYLRQIGSVLGLSLELITLDYSGVNFSASKASMGQSFKAFQGHQNFLKSKFHSKIVKWKIQEWINAGLVPNKVSSFYFDFITPSMPTVDVEKEAKGLERQLVNGISSLSEVHAALNKDSNSILEQQKDYIENAIKTANDLQAKYPDKVIDWRLFYPLARENTVPQPTEITLDNTNND